MIRREWLPPVNHLLTNTSTNPILPCAKPAIRRRAKDPDLNLVYPLLVNSAPTVRVLKAINDKVNPTTTNKLTFIDFSKLCNAFSNRCSN